jgi:hypothetical protein
VGQRVSLGCAEMLIGHDVIVRWLRTVIVVKVCA